ncbi:MAG: hypothetical protein IJM25_03795 [Eubacterium sp.]|nr:hypothetical protein [Eubacterium sp.]
MVKHFISVLLVCAFIFMIDLPSFAAQTQKDKEYRILVPAFPYTSRFDISDFYDQGILRIGWGCGLVVSLAERDRDASEAPPQVFDGLRSDEQIIMDASWDAVLPDGSIAEAHHVDKDGNAYYNIPFEMTGIMTVRASLDGITVAEFDVTVVNTYGKEIPIRGWAIDYSGTYYIKDNGELARGWIKTDGKWYYFNQDGIMQTGWQHVAYHGKYDWYYLSTETASLGKMKTGWQKIDDTWYCFRKDGTLASNEWYRGFWVSKHGTWKYQQKGRWKKNKNGWWFGDTSGWYAKNQEMRIDGVRYTFDAEGYLVE